MKEALRLALVALQRFIKYDYNGNPFDGKDVEGAEAITAIKAALAQTEQEPVAWHYPGGKPDQCTTDKAYAEIDPAWTPMYYKHEFVELTDEEIKEIVGPYGETPIKGYTRQLFDQIEAKLKEKNT